MSQSQSPAVALLGALIAGALGGAGITQLLPGPQPVEDVEPIGMGAGSDELFAEVAALRQANERLREQVEGFEARLLLAMDAPRAAASPEPASVEGVAAKLDGEDAKLLATLTDTDAPLPPEFRERVGQAMSQIREEEERERDARREELFNQQLDERMLRYTEKLGLAPYQTTQLRETLVAERARRNEAMNQARDSGDFGSLRETMRTVASETQVALGGFLTPEQLESYQQMDDRRGFGDFRGGGGGGGRGPGGGN